MARAFGLDLRKQVIDAIEAGASTREAARRFAIGGSTAGAWHRTRGSGHHASGGRDAPGNRARFRACIASVHGFFIKRGISYKKTQRMPPSSNDGTSSPRANAGSRGNPTLDPRRLIFIDETGATTKMARFRGRPRRGERCRTAVPHGHWKTTTLVAGLGLEGIEAPWILDGPMNGKALLVYVQRGLAPALSKGDSVIVDTLPAHKVAGVREAIEHVGARLLSPALSAGLQSNRDDLRQDQGLPPKSRRQNNSRSVGHHRGRHRNRQTRRVHRFIRSPRV